jgi:hypothetical protein
MEGFLCQKQIYHFWRVFDFDGLLLFQSPKEVDRNIEVILSGEEKYLINSLVGILFYHFEMKRKGTI